MRPEPARPSRAGVRPKPLLIVNADDFGLTSAVSDGILRAHDEGVVTSTSALALAPGFTPSVGRLAASTGLGVGAHLALVGEDPPLLSAREIPTLVDDRGALAASWRQFLARAATGRIDHADVERELSAQLDAVASALGRPLTHLDTHQNLHLWPSVGRVVLGLATSRNIRAVRVTRSSARTPVGVGVRRLARRLERSADRLGVRYPEASVGLDEAGSFDEPTMVAAVRRLAGAGAVSAELATHPGADPDPDRARYRWGYSWPAELEALCSEQVADAITRAGFELGTFADLPATAHEVDARG